MEYLAVFLCCVIALLVYLWANAKMEVADVQKAARGHEAEAKVQKARADRAMRVLKTWGGDIDELEQRAAAGRNPGQVKSHIRDLASRMRVPPDEGGGGSNDS